MFEDIQIPDSVQLPKGRRACRRKAEELRAVYRLHRQFATFAEEAEELPDWQAQPGQRQQQGVLHARGWHEADRPHRLGEKVRIVLKSGHRSDDPPGKS